MDCTTPQATRPTLEPDEFYFDGPNMVFTASYHLKRGSCCGSGCRHCPYGLAPADAAPLPDEASPPSG